MANKKAAIKRISVTVICPMCYTHVRTESSAHTAPPSSYNEEEGKPVLCHGCGNMIRVKVSAWNEKP